MLATARILILATTLCGCQPLPQDASRTYPPGRASDVARGAGQTGEGGHDGFAAPRVMSWRDFPRGSIPVIEPPEVIHIWFFPAISRDGAAFREGFWCHRVTRTFAWGAERLMVEGSVPVIPDAETRSSQLDAGRDDPAAHVEPQPSFLDSLQDLGHEAAPYVSVRTLPQTGEPAAAAATAPAAAVPHPAATAAPASRAAGGR